VCWQTLKGKLSYDLNSQVVPVHMWFGFFYALAYLVWTMIYFGWRGRWIYDFLDWSKPVFQPALRLVIVTSA